MTQPTGRFAGQLAQAMALPADTEAGDQVIAAVAPPSANLAVVASPDGEVVTPPQLPAARPETFVAEVVAVAPQAAAPEGAISRSGDSGDADKVVATTEPKEAAPERVEEADTPVSDADQPESAATLQPPEDSKAQGGVQTTTQTAPVPVPVPVPVIPPLAQAQVTPVKGTGRGPDGTAMPAAARTGDAPSPIRGDASGPRTDKAQPKDAMADRGPLPPVMPVATADGDQGPVQAGIATPAPPAASSLPATASAPVAAPATLAMTQPDWPVTLASASIAALTPEGGTMILEMTPEDLGALRITLTVEGDTATVRFQTETPEAARLLSEAERQLSAEFARSGVALTGHSAQSDRQAGHGGHAAAPSRMRADDGTETLSDTALPVRRGVINLIA